MVTMLFAARLRDLGPGDVVRVECLACDHDGELGADALRAAGVPDYLPILELRWKLACSACGARRKVRVTIRWGEMQAGSEG